jgi:hypothetical protein
MVDGRDGRWFVQTFGAAMASPGAGDPFRISCGGAAGSCFAACVSGTIVRSTVVSAVEFGFTLRSNAAPYDVGAYRGISFFYQGTVGPSSMLRFQATLAADVSLTDDAYMVPLTPLPGMWQYREVLFSDLHRSGAGTQIPWDPTTVVSFEWLVAGMAPPAPAGESFMVCVDQVELLPR